MSQARPILIIKTGTTLEEIAQRRGDFEGWIQHGLGDGALPTHVRVVYGDERPKLPEPQSLAGVIVTGSSAMVSHEEAWSEWTADWLAKVVEAQVPCLGICYGHQLLAKCLGGTVGPNPNGREIGTVTVRLSETADDPLLGGLESSARVQTSHVESVLSLPPGARLRGTTDLDPHHVFSVDDVAWGVQFHPEFDADVMRGYIRGRRPALVEEGIDADSLLDEVAETAAGDRLLADFNRLCGSRQGLGNGR